jgi:hypothetical protein
MAEKLKAYNAAHPRKPAAAAAAAAPAPNTK